MPEFVIARPNLSYSFTSPEIYMSSEESNELKYWIPRRIYQSAPQVLFEWLRNGVPIAGATGAMLQIPALTPADAGTYTVIIANNFGRTTNLVATVTMHVAYLNSAPRIIAGKLRLLLERPPNGTLLLEGSNDMQTWSPIHTIPITTPGPLVELPLETQPRFFRAKPWP